MKTNIVADRILELVKEEPVLIGELEAKLRLPLTEFGDAVAFLEKYRLVELSPSDEGEGPRVQITPSGLQLLNLPDLPEDELPSDQLKVLEQHCGEEMDVGDGRRWLFLMQLKNKISCELGRSEGTTTIKQEGDNYTLTAIIPIKEGVLHLQDDDISKCHHIPEEAKMEVDALFKRRSEQ